MKKILLLLMFILVGSIAQAEPYMVSSEAKLEYNQGVDFYKVGQYERAIGAFRRAINIDPNYIDAYFNLGSILDYMGQYEAALTVYRQLLVRKPDDYETIYKAADVSVRLGQPERAKELLAAIPPTSPTYSKAQELAESSLKTNMETLKSQQSQGTADKFTADDDVFTNIASPTGVSADGAGNVYVASFSDNVIYKITPENTRVMYLKDPRLNGPIGMVSDNAGNMYIANYNADNILKVSGGGAITVLPVSVQKPYGIYISGRTLFISCQGSNSVVQFKL